MIPTVVDYTTVSRDGRILPQQMSLRVPVKVVATGASVKQQKEDNWSPWELLLIPVRLVRGILEIFSGPNLEGW